MQTEKACNPVLAARSPCPPRYPDVGRGWQSLPLYVSHTACNTSTFGGDILSRISLGINSSSVPLWNRHRYCRLQTPFRPPALSIRRESGTATVDVCFRKSYESTRYATCVRGRPQTCVEGAPTTGSKSFAVAANTTLPRISRCLSWFGS